VQACLDLLCLRQTYGQTEVHWDDGITRGGASGAPLLANDGTWRVLGVLSNGTRHECGRPEQNLDNFGAFGAFLPQLACHLNPEATCEPSPEPPPRLCPINVLFGTTSDTAQTLREVRDGLLAKGGAGAGIVRTYYALAPALTECSRRSPLARHAMIVTASLALLFD